MICISVTPQSRRFAKADLLNASRQCDLIELCLDRLIKPPDMAELLSAVDKPVLVSCRRSEDGGHWKGDEEQRVTLLRESIVAGPAWVELDLAIAKKVPRYGETRRVVSSTSLYKPLGQIDAIFEQAADADADVVKFTWPTPTLEAAWPLLAAVSGERRLPVVGMGLGRCGLTFSLLGRKYGSPWIYAALERGMEAYEGQPTVRDLDEVHRWRSIERGTKFVGVAGFSDAALGLVRDFNQAADRLDLGRRWLPLAWDDPSKLLTMLDVLKITGVLAVSADGERLVDLAEHREAAVEAGGHADLLLKRDDGWHAYGSLWRAVIMQLESTLGGGGSDDRPLDRRNVLVIGSGGLAAALVFGVCRRRGLVSVSSGDDVAARQLAAAAGVRHVPSQNLYDTLADVVLLADPDLKVGTKKTELNPAFLRPPMLVLDAAQLDADSPLLTEARERGCSVVEPSAVRRDLLATWFSSITGQELPANDTR